MFGVSPIASGWHCRCGTAVEAGHFHTCNRVHGPATNQRHETVISEIATVAVSHLQMHVEKAPSIATADGQLIDGARHVVPDVVLRCAEFQLATDVSFVFSESAGRVAASHRSGKAALATVMGAMSTRARDKASKYARACARDGLTFEAFVMDSHGALDASAERVIKRLAQWAEDGLGLDGAMMATYIRRRLAIAAQRGNARLDQQAVAMSRGGYGGAMASGCLQPRPGFVGGAADQ